jgi:hypothetical protein
VIVDRITPSDAQLASLLGRTSPLVKLAVALGWLVGLAFTLELAPPIVIVVAALGAGHALGDIAWGAAAGVALLWLAAPGSACSTPCSRLER